MGTTTDQKFLYVGVGNLLKRDDGVGVYMVNHLLGHGKNGLVVEQSIEKYVGKINTMPHEILVLVDAVNFNQYPGYWKVIPACQLHDQTTNTHNISLRRITTFFKKPVYILGIQPANVSFGEGLSDLIQDVADKIIREILDSGPELPSTGNNSWNCNDD